MFDQHWIINLSLLNTGARRDRKFDRRRGRRRRRRWQPCRRTRFTAFDGVARQVRRVGHWRPAASADDGQRTAAACAATSFGCRPETPVTRGGGGGGKWVSRQADLAEQVGRGPQSVQPVESVAGDGERRSGRGRTPTRIQSRTVGKLFWPPWPRSRGIQVSTQNVV